MYFTRGPQNEDDSTLDLGFRAVLLAFGRGVVDAAEPTTATAILDIQLSRLTVHSARRATVRMQVVFLSGVGRESYRPADGQVQPAGGA